MKKLHRSNKNRILGGVCGGLGEYFEVDPVLIRLLSVLIVVITGIIPGLIVYVLALFIVPSERV